MTTLPQQPLKGVKAQLRETAGPAVRNRLPAIFDLAKRGKSPAQIVQLLGLSMTETSGVAAAIQVMGLPVDARAQFADLAQVREQMQRKRGIVTAKQPKRVEKR